MIIDIQWAQDKPVVRLAEWFGVRMNECLLPFAQVQDSTGSLGFLCESPRVSFFNKNNNIYIYIYK